MNIINSIFKATIGILCLWVFLLVSTIISAVILGDWPDTDIVGLAVLYACAVVACAIAEVLTSDPNLKRLCKIGRELGTLAAVVVAVGALSSYGLFGMGPAGWRAVSTALTIVAIGGLTLVRSSPILRKWIGRQ